MSPPRSAKTRCLAIVKLIDEGGQLRLELLSVDEPKHSRPRRQSSSAAPAARFFAAWHKGKAGVPFGPASARDLYAAFRAWCARSGEPEPGSETAFGTAISGELARAGLPSKEKRRWHAWSPHAVRSGDWAADHVQQQGIVYLSPKQSSARASGNGRRKTTVKDDVSKSVQRFQRRLHLLLAAQPARKGR